MLYHWIRLATAKTWSQVLPGLCLAGQGRRIQIPDRHDALFLSVHLSISVRGLLGCIWADAEGFCLELSGAFSSTLTCSSSSFVRFVNSRLIRVISCIPADLLLAS
jgi:hypothetical protein